VSDELKGDYALLCGQMAEKVKRDLARWLARREVALEGLFLIQQGNNADADMLKNEYIKMLREAAVERKLITYRE
jgi:hypothetical protein